MNRWQKEDHWQNLKIGVRNSWIGIEGIPLLMWNIHMFKIIRKACGGLLEVAEETSNKSHLGFAKLRVKGFESRLMNPIIELLCEGERICLGVFSIVGPDGGGRGYCTTGVMTRVVLQLG